MLLCEETSSVLDMLRPRVTLVEEACQCKEPLQLDSYAHSCHSYICCALNTIYQISQLSERARSCPFSAGSSST